jgi:predicted DNA-binding transcriptional regulator AlpA
MLDDQEPTDSRARRRAREDITLRFKELPWPDQYRVYEFVQGHFFHSGRGSERLREVRERAECVTAVRRVAKHLGMGEGEAPGVEEYERARKELGIEPSASTIIRRWEAWREVSKAARGERVSQSARQRAQFRAAIKQKPSGEEWLTGVREWLSEKPPTRYTCDYDAWAEERNERRPHAPPVATAESASRSLVLPWSLIVKVAQRDLSLADAQGQVLETLKGEDGEFIATGAVALIHGVTFHRAKLIVRGEGFPAHAFQMRESRIWHLSDVEAHHEGQPFPEREPGGLQGQILTTPEVSDLCGLTVSALWNAVSHGHPTAPPPSGRVRRLHFWFRITVEAWAEATGNEGVLAGLLARDERAGT